jgi:RNA polymerase sigma-70 factor (ECF subfamily)
MTKSDAAPDAFAGQGDVRRPWRRFLDALAADRPAIHRYCVRLTGNVWDGEDLMQDALARVFSLMGKIDADLENPRAYLIRTATNLWVDRVRRAARERAALALERTEAALPAAPAVDAAPAAQTLFQTLHPKERAAIVMKDVLDLSLEEAARFLQMSVSGVKAALHRGRGRLKDARPPAGFDAPPREIVERFMTALRDKELGALKAMCALDLTIELVGGAQSDSFEEGRMFFEHAHMVLPLPGWGAAPRWELAEYEGEPIVLAFRTLDGVEGLNEIHRLDVSDGVVTRVRCYCFAPDTLRAVAAALGLIALDRPYRSPAPEDFATI